MTPSPDTTGAVERLTAFAKELRVGVVPAPKLIGPSMRQAFAADLEAALSEITSLREALQNKGSAGSDLSRASDDLAYAQRLATYAASLYGPPDGWKPLDEMQGVLSQIDNALTGLVPREDLAMAVGTLELIAKLADGDAAKFADGVLSKLKGAEAA